MDWKIAREPDGSLPEVGKEYEIRHSRKGTFTGRVLGVHDGFAEVEITGGEPRHVSREAAQVDVGDCISIRDTLSYLIPVEVPDAE